MIDEKGKRIAKPADPPIPPHMLDGFNDAQRKALGLDEPEKEKSAEPAHTKSKK